MREETRETNLVKLSQVPNDDISMLLNDSEGEEEVEVGSQVVGPEHFPQLKRRFKRELSLEAAEDPSEAEEQVEGARLL
jgi:hypothetical protein